MDNSSVTNEPGSRSYRLRTRRRPCDQCRSRKLKCQAEGEKPPCRRCEQTHTRCTFDAARPRRGTGPNRSALFSPATPTPSANLSYQTEDDNHSNEPLSNAGETIATASPGFLQQSEIAFHPASILDSSVPQAQLQFPQTLDGGNDQTCILLGTSSESDPWLLRHCQFDEYGLRSFYGLQFRNIGGVPNRQKIPVHFILTSKHPNEGTGLDKGRLLRDRLNVLIPVAWGLKLIKL